ncbi:MAG: hypothetical protein AB7E80_06730 [Hyphomicrobiaceae bacterium]
MTTAFDLTDLPQVPQSALALAMRLLVEDGKGLIVSRGASADDRAQLEASFWQAFDGETEVGVATLVRLWSMIDVFQSRRMHALLLDRGFALVKDAVAVAASMRLNIDWGFNPQRFLLALSAGQPVRSRPVQATAEVYALAA